MKNCKSLLAGLILSFGLTAGVAQAAPIAVTDLDAFNSAIGGAAVTLDTFDTNNFGETSITFESGVVSTRVGVNSGFIPVLDNGVSGSRYRGNVHGGRFNLAELVWTFPVPVVGFIADFSDVGLPIEATISGSGQKFDIADVMGGRDGSFGLLDSMAPFTEIRFSMREGLPASGYLFIDNLRFAAAPSAVSVSEPGTLAILATGLAGFALAGRRRRKMNRRFGF
ncbi:PEP-CTERM sorting domain-containing protein [Denitrobaculum tricleocarpae]|uniref:PEP-CTERM sorting domain-containing protein n=1 Tax=Denitrobaculum tricleocarpae TaxID=2591009 RepID=A0A545TL29_9PROT|nr:PEP-CTERM sorting domain-containing protein [Denitrobaculum tricleocarpae]TQV77932.1 PEP-CTERM sorting domain-containing protein [Denitrobaculum tricleocarpae]